MMNNLLSVLILMMMATSALPDWDTPPWPSPSYPRYGAVHNTNTSWAIRERGCAAGLGFEGVAVDYSSEWGLWDVALQATYGPYLYRYQRDWLVRYKQAITNLCGSFVYVDGDSSIRDLTLTYNLDSLGMWTPGVLESERAYAGWLTNTSYRALFSDATGWRHVTNVLDALVATVANVTWTDAKACGETNTYNFGSSQTITSVYETVTNTYENMLAWNRYAWYRNPNTITCPVLAANWPGGTYSPSDCVPTNYSVAAQAPNWSISIENNIDWRQSFRLSAEPAGNTNDNAWTSSAFSCGNTQNTYTAGYQLVSAVPVVTNLCTYVAHIVHFYVKAGGVWTLMNPLAAETLDATVTGPRINPADLWGNQVFRNEGDCTICTDTPTSNEYEYCRTWTWTDNNRDGNPDGAGGGDPTEWDAGGNDPPGDDGYAFDAGTYDWYWGTNLCENFSAANCDYRGYQFSSVQNGYATNWVVNFITNYTARYCYSPVLDVVQSQAVTDFDTATTNVTIQGVKAVVWWNAPIDGYLYYD